MQTRQQHSAIMRDTAAAGRPEGGLLPRERECGGRERGGCTPTVSTALFARIFGGRLHRRGGFHFYAILNCLTIARTAPLVTVCNSFLGSPGFVRPVTVALGIKIYALRTSRLAKSAEKRMLDSFNAGMDCIRGGRSRVRAISSFPKIP